MKNRISIMKNRIIKKHVRSQIEDKQIEIVDFFKKWHGDENDELNLEDISITDLTLFIKENRRDCYFLFQRLMDLIAEDQRQIINNDSIWYSKRNLAEHKLLIEARLKKRPLDQQERYKLNERNWRIYNSI